MRITVLVGSPRKSGNTETLADALIAGVQAAGGEAVKYSVRGKKIGPCLSCGYCLSHDHCVLKDDMDEVYSLMERTDVLVFASPIYFYGMSAQLAALINRFHNPVRERFPIRAAAVLGVCADDPPETFAPMLATFAAIEEYLGWQHLGDVTVTGVEQKGDIAGHEGLARARALGEALAAYAG